MQVPASISADAVDRIADERDEPDWLREQRHEALAALPSTPLPDVIHTPGRKWTNLEALDFEALVDPFSDTEEKDRVGPEGVEVYAFDEALEAIPAIVREHFGSVIDPTENYLTALQTALFTTGTVIYVPEGVDADAVTVRTRMQGQSLFNYTLIVSETSSSVTILERQSNDGSGGEHYYSGLVEAVVGPNSHVQYGSLQQLTEETYHYSLKRGDVDRDGSLTWIEANLGSRLTKSSVETTLEGDGSETKIVGAFFGHNDQHFDIASRVWHEGEHTTADLVTRGVLDDAARSVYEGVQDVGTEAWNTSSYQRENTLMLSDESEADASPKLIINNHDTEASHSATVGQIDQEDLFYMVTRGVPPQLATDMLVEGFFVPVLEEIDVEELREDLQAGIHARLDQ